MIEHRTNGVPRYTANAVPPFDYNARKQSICYAEWTIRPVDIDGFYSPPSELLLHWVTSSTELMLNRPRI